MATDNFDFKKPLDLCCFKNDNADLFIRTSSFDLANKVGKFIEGNSEVSFLLAY